LRRPMLAFQGSKSDLARPGFIFEPKLDGTRALCYKDGAHLRFVNRRDHEMTPRYPEFDFAGLIDARSCVLDGEVVVFDGQGNPSFLLLQKREHAAPGMYHLRSSQHPATYVVFDMLEIDGRDLTGLPLSERKRLLDATVREDAHLRKIVYTPDGQRLWDLIYQKGIEGVMAKSVDGTYEEGRRSLSWLKIKTIVTIDCVIVGYTHERRAISSLALGIYVGKDLRFIGRVGTGFTDDFLVKLRERLDGIGVPDPSVVNPPEGETEWVRPEIVCEVEYLELTSNYHLRAPSFRRLREDKLPEECTLDVALRQVE
jgi:bifunctional non-homologous end joining protein LigD